MHYRLILENYEKGAKIFSRGHDCQNIFFIVQGEMELYIDQNNKEFELDTLTPGSIVGQYSVINESPYQYSGKAKTNLSILVLNREDIFHAAEDYIELTEQIEIATQHIIDFGTPWIDYKIAPSFGISKQSSFSKIDEMPGVGIRDVGSIFRNAVRRVTVLNRSKELKVFKLFELINWIKQEKKKQQQANAGGEMIGGGLNQSAPNVKIAGRKSSVQNLTNSNFVSKRHSIRAAIQPAPPRTKSSQQLKMSLDFNNNDSQPVSDNKREAWEHFNSQNSNTKFSFEFNKLNRRLDHITELLAGLTGDMSNVKVKLSISKATVSHDVRNLSTFGQAAHAVHSTKDLLKDKEPLISQQERRVSYQVQMSGIIEDEKENSSLNSSVSDTTPTTQNAVHHKNRKQSDQEKPVKHAEVQSQSDTQSKVPAGWSNSGVFGGIQGLGDVVKALQNSGTIANRVSALDIQMRKSVISQPRMSRMSELGQSLKTSPFNSRQSSMDVSPTGNASKQQSPQSPKQQQVPRSPVQAPPSPKIPPLQMGKLLSNQDVINQDQQHLKVQLGEVKAKQDQINEQETKMESVQKHPEVVHSDASLQQPHKQIAVTVLQSPQQTDFLPQNFIPNNLVANQEIQPQNQPLEASQAKMLPPQQKLIIEQNIQQPQLSKHINQHYIQQVMSLIQKKQAATQNQAVSSPIGQATNSQQPPQNQYLSKAVAQSIIRAASPSSSAGLIQQQQQIHQIEPSPQSQPYQYTQLNEEQSSSFATLQSATMQYLQRSGISGMLGGAGDGGSQVEEERDDGEESKHQGIFSGQQQYQGMTSGQQSKNKTNFFRLTNSRNQVQPAPNQQTVQELSKTALEVQNQRMTMSPRKNHQDLTKYQPNSFITPNQVHITLNSSQASSILTTVAQNLLGQRNHSPPPPVLSNNPQQVQIDIESNSAKSTYNQTALLRKSRDKQAKQPPGEMKPPASQLTFHNQMTPAFPKNSEKQMPPQSVDGDEEEEEYDEESMGELSGQGVDAMIEQEIERMIEDGRRTEDENYDQGANDATRSDI
ncbi:hypothetical protein FGO68_gene562 [Halteria grandinella]|uniref:Cyclic nucleotide-binding domain-containing protein n=1 Tax=Halteria grandinella TaxID=5974 RepID=A0A8J8SXR0_HALGN|nr:hypothetical protein FGO68_gene562 [Halteria grandinella]